MDVNNGFAIGGRMTTIAAPATRFGSLRRILFIDAGTCLASGSILSAFPQPLARFFGLPSALLLYAGLSLFPVAALMIWIATREELPHAGVAAIVLGNGLWIAGSVLLIAIGPVAPTPLGYGFIVGQAVLVALLADLEYAALRGADGSQGT
jgi:hypothetical protein